VADHPLGRESVHVETLTGAASAFIVRDMPDLETLARLYDSAHALYEWTVYLLLGKPNSGFYLLDKPATHPSGRVVVDAPLCRADAPPPGPKGGTRVIRPSGWCADRSAGDPVEEPMTE
jgi:hypothetical protein